MNSEGHRANILNPDAQKWDLAIIVIIVQNGVVNGSRFLQSNFNIDRRLFSGENEI